MSRPVSRPTSDRANRSAAKPAWRLPELVPQAGPPGPIWKFLLAATILVQVAWIVALIVMATK
jgi:hypothetical protein